MNLSEISIKRPVTIIMCMLIVMVLGIFSFVRIPMDLLPQMNIPIAIVYTGYQNVGPQEVENLITRNIENSMATVSNVKSIQSQTAEGVSIVIVEFSDGTDMDFATLQMREKVDLVKGMLPDAVDSPMVMKIDPNMIPVAQLGVTSDKLNKTDLKNMVEENIQNRFERLVGVAAADISGGVEREIKIELDPVKMAGYKINFDQITGILRAENNNFPGGSVEYGNKNLIVKSKGEFESIEDIRNVPIILPQGNIIYIRDIGTVSDGLKEVTSLTRENQRESIGISVQKQTVANTVEVLKLIKDEISEIQKDYPEIKINISFDQGKFIEMSVNSVISNAVSGAILAMLVLFIFLRNVRSTLIIGISIPVSIIATFTLMYFTDMTLNMISMGGLALGIGMMVDTSIVVLENIYRHRDLGENRIQAALIGTKEVGGAVIASTLTSVVVFLPIVFAQGMAGSIFRQMALTVTFANLTAMVVAITIVPMLSSKMLKISKSKADRKTILDKIFDSWGNFFDKLDERYRDALRWVLGHRKITVIAVAVVFVVSIGLVPFIGAEFIPASDQSQFTVAIEMPEGTILSETDAVVREIEEVISGTPEVETLFVTAGSVSSGGMSFSVGSHTASMSATLVPIDMRKKSTNDVVEEVRKKTENITGAKIKITAADMISSMGGGGTVAPIAIEITGHDLEQLEIISQQVMSEVKAVPGTRQVESSISGGRPESRIRINREKAAQYGMTASQIASAIRTSVSGQVATTYKVGGDEIDINVSLPGETVKTLDQMKNIKIVSPQGSIVLLSDVADYELEEGPVTITRKDQTRYATVSTQLFNRDVGSVMNDIREKVDLISLPDGYTISYGGQNELMEDAFSSLAQALLLSLLLVYMVMAAQFESLLQPFIIMFSVPLGFSGAAIGLAITNRTINVPSLIGIIMLSGIVVSNAIILIDYINHLRKEEGMEINEAVITAGPIRLRPILMTTLATVLGMLPLAVGLGEGAEVQSPLATVVVFGLTLSTFVTLLLVPVIYTIFDDIHMKLKRKKKDKKVLGVQAAGGGK